MEGGGRGIILAMAPGKEAYLLLCVDVRSFIILIVLLVGLFVLLLVFIVLEML